MADRIPYEDVQSAATQLTQCTNNVITVRIFSLIRTKHIRSDDL